jgi:competence protein ComEC
MAQPVPIPDSLFTPLPAGETLVDHVGPDDLVYFLCNVGDGDAQLLLLPEQAATQTGTRMRRAIVVDSASPTKIPRLLRSLVDAGLLPAQTGSQTQPADGAIALVVATHPHRDHIGGISQLLTGFAGAVSEMWEPGYYHTGPDYIEMMNAIESQASLLYAQPTSGLRRWFGNVAVTVLTPSIQLRNRFDTYGVEVNNASISLRVEFPATRVVQRGDDRSLLDTPNTKSLILGADAQTLSWSYADTDFPVLAASDTAAAKAIKAATGSDPFRSQVLKVSHHASKHGVNLELVERIRPALTLVSSVAGGGSYRFPHTVGQELIREAIDPTTTSGAAHPPDWELGIFYTSDTSTAGAKLGSFAVVIGAGQRTTWRMLDSTTGAIDLSKATRWTG